MTKIKEIIRTLETWAPPKLAESYDNVGLIVGDADVDVSGIVVSLDCTEAIVEEAISKGCNLIVSHHPIVFKGLKKLNGKNYVERTVLKAIKNDIALYAIHTNLDNVDTGVNKMICDKLGIENPSILSPKSDRLQKLTCFVPVDHLEAVRSAVFEAGGGNVGNYSHCSFTVVGEGTFLPEEGANPFAGKVGNLERANEARVEIIFPDYLGGQILSAMKSAHPYEEVAYYHQHLINRYQEVGSGMVGHLPSEMSLSTFLKKVKADLGLKVLKYTPVEAKSVSKVAVCGGSGSFLIPSAKAAGADVLISSDMKYHEFFDGEGEMVIADIGHYESERFTIDLIADYISEKFSTFATHLTGVNTNPIDYI